MDVKITFASTRGSHSFRLSREELRRLRIQVRHAATRQAELGNKYGDPYRTESADALDKFADEIPTRL